MRNDATINDVTLIVILGFPKKTKSGDYETARYKATGIGESAKERVTPLFGLVELYKPSHLIAVCTAEAKESYNLFLEEWRDSGLSPELQPLRMDIDLFTNCQTADSLLRKLAEITPTTQYTHLDVTFGPRSISVAALLCALVQKSAGQWNLTRMTYVNFEARPPSESSAPIPIEDITYYLALPALALGVEALKKRGDIAAFADGVKPFLQSGEKLADPHDLEIVVEAVSLLRTTSLLFGEAGKSLNNIIIALRKISENPLLSPILEDAEKILHGLQVGSNIHGDIAPKFSKLVRWYQHHNQPEKALLLASEALTFCVCKNYLKSDYPQKRNHQWMNATDYYREAKANHQKDHLTHELLQKTHNLWQTLHNMRSDYAHVSLTSKPSDSARVSIEEINRLLDEFHEVCKAL